MRVTHYRLAEPDRLIVLIESTLNAAVCPDCQQLSLTVHETSPPQMIRDLPMWNRTCWLQYAPRRFKCLSCNDTFVERVLWREPGLDYTVRYEHYIYQRARRELIAPLAQDEDLSQDIVQGIFARGAKKNLSNAAIQP